MEQVRREEGHSDPGQRGLFTLEAGSRAVKNILKVPRVFLNPRDVHWASDTTIQFWQI